ncbi:MAG: hypothetical protein EXX96DRAFT_612530 [Benjaminiella poitrasii]|nr:MAG: hypothetical protein EXX96DRAFT_612530 [Benjaminiella poitrasii]
MNLLGSYGKMWTWVKKGKALKDHNVNFRYKGNGGSLMLWNCFTQYSPGFIAKIESRMDSQLYRRILKDISLNSALFMVLRFYENEQIEIHRDFRQNIPLSRDVIRFIVEERNQLNLARHHLQEIQLNPQTETDLTLVHENMMTVVVALDQLLNYHLQINQDIFVSFQQIIAQTEDFDALENIGYLHMMPVSRTIIEKVAGSIVATRGILTEVLALQQTIIDTISDHQNNIQQANTLLNRLNRSIESSTNETTRTQLFQVRVVLLANLRAATERAVGFEAQNQRILQDTIVQVFLDSPNFIRESQDYTTTSNHFIEQCTIIEGKNSCLEPSINTVYKFSYPSFQ